MSGTVPRADYALGVDIGGTFTDIVAFDPATGARLICKESTTPDDPVRGVMTGLGKLLSAHRLDPGRIGRVVHATTLFTNALIERKGAATGLITTAGFADILEIGRERKYELYDLFLDMPRPLVARPWRCEVAGRLAPDGAEEIPLDPDALRRAARFLAAQGVESLAVCFLHAYANPAHERAAAAILAEECPAIPVSLSSDIAPEIREFPRLSTTVANAYVRPLAERYLGRLETALAEAGIPGPLFLMLSNGGLTHVAEAIRAPVQLLESGPAAGALAGAWFGRGAGVDRVLAFDMGGTTAKLALVDDGEPLRAWGFEAARTRRFLRGSGLPIQIATIELIEIGAGGGSIARASDLGTLAVGPESAGADPGPVCYRRGGGEPTVTDADLLLGALDADFFLGGAMPIDAEAAGQATAALGGVLGLDEQDTAQGIQAVVNEAMAGAARVAIAERGRAAADYALMATGGAAPVHAWQVARELGIARLLCPPGAGVGSTIGMLMAPARVDRVASFTHPLAGIDADLLDDRFASLAFAAGQVLAASGADPTQAVVRRLADMRYIGQGSEITIVVPDEADEATLRAAFEAEYRFLFARTPPGAAVQFVALRLSLSAPMPGASAAVPWRSTPGRKLRKGVRAVWFAEAGGFVEAAVYDRYALPQGARFHGPAVVEENESTLLIGPGGVAEVLRCGTIAVDLPPVGGKA